MKNLSLDHLALAVANLEDSIKIYEHLGLVFKPEREVVASQKVTAAFAPIGDKAHLELLEPLNNQGPIADFIKKRGPGIHHICFRVNNIEEKCLELKKKGIKLIYEKPQEGANKMLVNFIHPKSTGGVLIELSQSQQESR